MQGFVIAGSVAWLAVSAAFAQATLNLARVPGVDQGPGIPACSEERGWYSLFDGTGASLEKYFFNPSGQKHGDDSRWWVTNRILYSDQSPDRRGGVIYTKRTYKNVEMKVEIKPYWTNDGGIFFRANYYGRSYQVVIDYHTGQTASVGGVWGEARPTADQGINYKPFGFNSPTSITLRSEWYSDGLAGRPRLAAADWAARIWKANDFNWVHGKIYNDDIPWIDTWINKQFQMVHYEDPASKARNEVQIGHVGLQVHQGANAWSINNPNLYRAILIREIQGSGNPLAAYPEWTQACGTGKIRGRASPPAAAPALSWTAGPGRSLKVAVSAPEPYALTLSDLAGRILHRIQAPGGGRTHVVPLPDGQVYLLELRAGETHQIRQILQPRP